MKVALVTGALGFLGSEIARRLEHSGWRVQRTGRGAADSLDNFVAADLRDAEAVRRLVRGVDVVIHAAGVAHRDASPLEFEQGNVTATENVVKAAAKSSSECVVVSSVSVYGDAPGIHIESTSCRPVSLYAASKLEAERRATLAASSSSLRLTVLRMATVYGEGDPGNCGRLLRAIATGRFVWIGRGENRKSLVYRSDAAEACRAALGRKGGRIETYNISATPVRMKDIVEAYVNALGKRMGRLFIPGSLAWLAAGFASALCLHRGPASRHFRAVRTWLRNEEVGLLKARDELAFEARTSLEEGVRLQVDAYVRGSSDIFGC